MKNNEIPKKIGAPTKAETKTKISVTLENSDITNGKASSKDGESFSAFVSRAIKSLVEKERIARPLRPSRTRKPKGGNTDRA